MVRQKYFDGVLGSARNPYMVNGDTVSLTVRSKDGLHTDFVDRATFDRVSHVRWHTHYALPDDPSSWYTRGRVNGRDVGLHRFVWELSNGPVPRDLEVDHVSGNKRDNRLKNLRLSSSRDQKLNRCRYAKGSKIPLYGPDDRPRRRQRKAPIKRFRSLMPVKVYEVPQELAELTLLADALNVPRFFKRGVADKAKSIVDAWNKAPRAVRLQLKAKAAALVRQELDNILTALFMSDDSRSMSVDAIKTDLASWVAFDVSKTALGRALDRCGFTRVRAKIGGKTAVVYRMRRK